MEATIINSLGNRIFSAKTEDGSIIKTWLPVALKIEDLNIGDRVRIGTSEYNGLIVEKLNN